LRTIDGQLRLVATAAIAEVFELAWMDKFFPVHADVADAVANVNEVGNRRDRDGDVEPAVHSRAVHSR
jgi:hypothetical protein